MTPNPSEAADALTIVEATAHHGEAVSALHRLCFDEPWSPFTVRQVMNMPGAFGLVAVPGTAAAPQGLAGFALARRVAGECEILSLAVAEDWRGRGLGGRLLDAAIARARAAGCGTVFLEVAEDNRIAQRLYRARGFSAVGRRPDYYRRREGPAAAALTFSLVLGPG